MAEVLYNGGGGHEEHVSNPVVMSEKVQCLANSIYREFETMISMYGDAVIKDLMPQVVSILESLNIAYREKQEQEVDCELLREENNNLRLQFEKEKQLRKMTEQKYLETEDSYEEERKQHARRVESLESNVRRLEVKIRNAHDQLMRQEERKTELKEENTKLHLRYNEVMRSHAEYVERVKLSEKSDPSSPQRVSLPLAAASLKHVESSRTEESEVLGPITASSSDEISMTEEEIPIQVEDNLLPLQNLNKQEVTSQVKENESSEKSQDQNDGKILAASLSGDLESGMPESVNDESPLTDSAIALEDKPSIHSIGAIISARGDCVVSVTWVCMNKEKEENAKQAAELFVGCVSSLPDIDYEEDFDHASLRLNIPRSEDVHANTSSLFSELSSHNLEALNEIDMGADISSMSVSGEFEKIIQENNELLQTKNALNIVKDDLIAQLDEMSGELELLREELRGSCSARERLEARVAELEEELKKSREQLEECQISISNDYRFSRMDMTRVIMERNSFKEKLMELQEAVRYAETLRASREHPELVNSSPSPSTNKKKGAIWSFFNSLAGGSSSPSPPSSPRNEAQKIESLNSQTNRTPSQGNKPPTII